MLSARYWAREFRPTILNKTCPSNERLISHSFCSSLQSRRFCAESLRYIDRCRHLEKQNYKTNGGGAGKGGGEDKRKMPASKAKTGERQKRRGRERPQKSENRANDFIACWDLDRIVDTEWFVRRRTFCSNLQSVIFLFKASESQFQSHIAAKSRNEFLRKHLVDIKKERDLPLAESVAWDKNCWTKRS